MVGADNWSLCADAGTRSLDSQDKLEHGGKSGAERFHLLLPCGVLICCWDFAGRQGCGTLEA